MSGQGRGVVRTYDTLQRARDKLFTRLAARDFATFGRGSTLQLPIRLNGTERIKIGEDVFVGPNSWLHALTSEHGTGRITIGPGSSLAGGVTVSAVEEIEIGHDVLIARHVYVSDHSHRFERIDAPIIAQGINRVAPVCIEAGAWIGQNVVVLPGARIGAGSVIGANSVVRGEIRPHCVAVGAPARVVD